MYDTSGAHSICRPSAVGHDVHARLNYLRAEIALAESGALARRESEGRAAMMMREPVDVVEAYGWFGLFLGLFPPAAIFLHPFLDEIGREGFAWAWLGVALLMNVVCAFVGRKAARFIAGKMGDPRLSAWPLWLVVSAAAGVFWGAVTGGAGGFVVFGVGAVVGAFVAAAIALVAFPAFALLHRQLSRGGMIEERALWPLAFGVTVTIAAAILGL